MSARLPADLLRRYDEQVRRRPPWPGVEHADRLTRVIGDGWHGVVWSDLDEATADAVIAREIERFAASGEWEWKHYSHDRPANLADRLLATGFVAGEPETMLVAPLNDLTLDASPPDGVDLAPVEDEAGVAALVRVHEEVFGGDYRALGRQLLADLGAGRAAAVVAMAGVRPICAGRIEFYEGTEFASLYGGGTVPDWRRRGVFQAVVAYRAARAAARGFRYLQTDASADSRPILEQLGFIALGTTTPFVHR